ncbi:hypothetical protein [Aliarcobacter cryaerophilus]|uniref:hypothetical protein n=1 Tax=Aliarcobacter cryaerophilus TaxID=28198 RepID=UPI0021B5C53F|nr:hypothetical protein [Aliarcobacter cryaerophilus]MCT7519045.1 hypothetical protein [Aliarcobacter cryaerophilus]
MNKIEELKKLLEKEVLPELKAEIEALEKLFSKKNDKEIKEELNYFLEVKKFYDEALKLINENKLTQEEAENILLDLEDMEDDEEEI